MESWSDSSLRGSAQLPVKRIKLCSARSAETLRRSFLRPLVAALQEYQGGFNS
ncbi:hypothetical protein MPC4_70132 [Methylocella tundrae]|uniref:Uncharacterized protein n=1 Tax=Methylocella tundrae TaxID=227605 RepID=A0A8B6MBF0_METTU|nr:hypothetical protein MPC4_70132 [Methylocella tundrae]